MHRCHVNLDGRNFIHHLLYPVIRVLKNDKEKLILFFYITQIKPYASDLALWMTMVLSRMTVTYISPNLCLNKSFAPTHTRHGSLASCLTLTRSSKVSESEVYIGKSASVNLICSK